MAPPAEFASTHEAELATTSRGSAASRRSSPEAAVRARLERASKTASAAEHICAPMAVRPGTHEATIPAP